MRTFIAAAVAAVATAVMSEDEFAFIQYIAKHGKNYTSQAEYAERFSNYMAMDAEIKKFNVVGSTSRHAHNKFSDRSRAEMKAMNGYIPAPKDSATPVHQVTSQSNQPASVNWVTAGFVLGIQDQG